MKEIHYHRVLTIAGSDSGGGAGIQADLKTFSALGCYGTSAITALTAQNTTNVRSIHTPPTRFLDEQLDSILSDIGTDAVKIGMLHSPECIQSVAEKMQQYRVQQIVLDPVMVATNGDPLITAEAVSPLRNLLFPIATIITPNLPESSILLGREITDEAQMEAACYELLQWSSAVLLKGGHLKNVSYVKDCLMIRREGKIETLWLRYPRIQTQNTHGTGCTLSAAIAACLAKRAPLIHAVKEAREYLQEALETGALYKLGHGRGPVCHFYRISPSNMKTSNFNTD